MKADGFLNFKTSPRIAIQERKETLQLSDSRVIVGDEDLMNLELEATQ